MKQNMNVVDRTVRTIIALTIGLLYMTDQITGVAALVLGAFTVIFLVTSAIGSCLIYTGLKLSTNRVEKA